MLYTYHIFVMHSSIDGQLGCFQILVIANNHSKVVLNGDMNVVS